GRARAQRDRPARRDRDDVDGRPQVSVARRMRAPVVAAAMLAAASCATQSPPTAQLIHTYVLVASVEGTAVTIRPGTREPHLVLRREGSRLAGFAGCNSLSGSFREDPGTVHVDEALTLTTQ